MQTIKLANVKGLFLFLEFWCHLSLPRIILRYPYLIMQCRLRHGLLHSLDFFCQFPPPTPPFFPINQSALDYSWKRSFLFQFMNLPNDPFLPATTNYKRRRYPQNHLQHPQLGTLLFLAHQLSAAANTTGAINPCPALAFQVSRSRDLAGSTFIQPSFPVPDHQGRHLYLRLTFHPFSGHLFEFFHLSFDASKATPSLFGCRRIPA